MSSTRLSLSFFSSPHLLSSAWCSASTSVIRCDEYITRRGCNAEVLILHFLKLFYSKSFLKETILQSESERGVNSTLITILRFWKIVQNGPSLRILSNCAQIYFIYFLQKKWSFVMFVCLLQLCPILAYLKKNWSTHAIKLRKMLLRRKLLDVRFANCLRGGGPSHFFGRIYFEPRTPQVPLVIG